MELKIIDARFSRCHGRTRTHARYTSAVETPLDIGRSRYRSAYGRQSHDQAATKMHENKAAKKSDEAAVVSREGHPVYLTDFFGALIFLGRSDISLSFSCAYISLISSGCFHSRVPGDWGT